MKRCPECSRDYYDDSLNFCLDDGAELLYGSSTSDPSTALFPQQLASGDHDVTRAFGVRSAESTRENNSIAVLPFKNISTEAENEYFCEGLAEEILNALAKIGEIKVAARTSAFSFKDKTTEVSEIGRKLGVSTILEGSVRKSGDRLRIAVQLVSASDGYHVWSETFDRMMSDIFDVQDEITLAVVDALKLKLLGRTKTDVLKRDTENTDAYKAYLKGRYLRYAKNDHSGASLEFQKAVELDRLHAPSWVALAESYVLRAHYALLDPLEACAKSREALEKAHSIQGESAESLYIKGFAAVIERDWNAMFAAYRRSIELDPKDPRTLSTFGVINCVIGKVDDGLAVLERARAVDPLAPYPYAMTACGLVCARRPEDSMRFLNQGLAFVPDHPLTLWILSMAEVALGHLDEGVRAAEKTVTLSNRAAFSVAVYGWALARGGRTEEAIAMLDELSTRPEGSPIAPAQAGLLATLGDIDSAIELYSKAVDEHAPTANYVGLPCFDELRADSRFDEIVRRLNFPE